MMDPTADDWHDRPSQLSPGELRQLERIADARGYRLRGYEAGVCPVYEPKAHGMGGKQMLAGDPDRDFSEHLPDLKPVESALPIIGFLAHRSGWFDPHGEDWPLVKEVAGEHDTEADLLDATAHTEQRVREYAARLRTIFEDVRSILGVIIAETERELPDYLRDDPEQRRHRLGAFYHSMKYFWLHFAGGGQRTPQAKAAGDGPGLEVLMQGALASAVKHGAPAVIAKAPHPELLDLMDRRDELLEEALPVARTFLAQKMVAELPRRATDRHHHRTMKTGERLQHFFDSGTDVNDFFENKGDFCNWAAMPFDVGRYAMRDSFVDAECWPEAERGSERELGEIVRLIGEYYTRWRV